jgi:hypothetical protein
LEVANLIELVMINSILVVVAAVLLTTSLGHYIGTGFAMHDSTLGVNTWLASDNSTQLNTIDLNNGPTAPTADAGGAAETEDEVVEDEVVEDEEVDEEPEETPTDENGTDEEDE